MGKENSINMGILNIGGRPVTAHGYDTSVGLTNSFLASTIF